MISDIHGNRHLLEQLLQRCNYRSDRDHLIILGDLIEKGSDSLGTLRYVMELCRQGQVDVLMGNCDAIPLQIAAGIDLDGLYHYLQHAPWKNHMLLWEMARLCGADLETEANVSAAYQQILQAFPEEFAFLSALPHVLYSDTMLFVHAGVESENPPYGEDAYSIMKNDSFACKDVHFQKMVICGHTPVISYRQIPSANPWYCEAKNIYTIDGGCGVKADGQLNALIMEDGMFYSLHVDDLPKGMVLRNYYETQEQVVNICWQTRRIEKRKESVNGTLCYHASSDQEVLIPNDLLYEEQGHFCSRDFSNHRLTVFQGDVVGIIREWNNSVYVKRNGVYGWIPKEIVKRMES